MQHRSLKTQERIIANLVKQAQAGDTDAFSKLYDVFFQPLYRYLYYRSNGDCVEDLLETVFLKIWTNLSKYSPNGDQPAAGGYAPFSAWAFRIAHNVLIDFYRASRPISEISEDHASDKKEHVSSHLIEQKLHKETLKKALGKLKTSYQQIIILKFINELGNGEISRILGKSENSLRILQFRALKALKKELESMGITEY